MSLRLPSEQTIMRGAGDGLEAVAGAELARGGAEMQRDGGIERPIRWAISLAVSPGRTAAGIGARASVRRTCWQVLALASKPA